MSIIRKLIDYYHFINHDLADSRTNDWFMVGSPSGFIAIVILYLMLIKKWLPAFMKNRPAYQLKPFIILYNLVQIISCFLLCKGMYEEGWSSEKFVTFSCQNTDYSRNPGPMRMANLLWWTMMMKVLDFLETMMFILRKKDKQASFLHVYHHISTLFILWYVNKYIAGVFASFPIMLNNGVHVLMYSYYTLSLSKNLEKYIIKYKQTLTVIQMIQFIIILIFLTQIFTLCENPDQAIKYFAIFVFSDIALLLFLFYQFYRKAYNKKN